MIYTGQPAGNNHRLAFFEKDCIDTMMYNDGQKYLLYKGLNELRANNFALWSPEIGAKMVRLESNNDKVFAAVRHATCKKGGDNTVIAVMNMSAEEQVVSVSLNEYAGEYTCLCGQTKSLDAVWETTLKPWQYCVLAK